MVSKLMDYKLKWLLIGVIAGVLLSAFMPESLRPHRFSKGKSARGSSAENDYQFAKYSQWPPFLTDPSFDLVTPIVVSSGCASNDVLVECLA